MKEYAKGFYQSAAWKRTRQTVIKRANGLCERCKAAGLYVPGVIVHHKEYITPNNVHDASVTLDPVQQTPPPGGQILRGVERTEGDTPKKLCKVARI